MSYFNLHKSRIKDWRSLVYVTRKSVISPQDQEILGIKLGEKKMQRMHG